MGPNFLKISILFGNHAKNSIKTGKKRKTMKEQNNVYENLFITFTMANGFVFLSSYFLFLTSRIFNFHYYVCITAFFCCFFGIMTNKFKFKTFRGTKTNNLNGIFFSKNFQFFPCNFLSNDWIETHYISKAPAISCRVGCLVRKFHLWRILLSIFNRSFLFQCPFSATDMRAIFKG